MLVIDDSSPDGTAIVVRDVMSTEPHIRLVERPRRSGLASAYLEGFRLALDEGYDLVVEMDSDLSHDPIELPGLLEAAATGADLAVGSRYVAGGSVSNWSRGRVALSRAGNTYARFMLGIPVHDATSGFRAYRRALLTGPSRRPHRLAGLRLPDRAGVPIVAPGSHDDSRADYVPRTRTRTFEDLALHRRGGSGGCQRDGAWPSVSQQPPTRSPPQTTIPDTRIMHLPRNDP